MSTLVTLLLLLCGLFAIPAVLAARSEKTVMSKLEKDGVLCLGTVRDYDSDGIVTVDFFPRGTVASVSAQGRGHFLKKHFPPGSQMAVLYNPFCPAMNAVVSERTDEALVAARA